MVDVFETDEKDVNLLIIDDDKDILFAAELLLEEHFQKVHTAIEPELARTILIDNKVDVVLLDMNFDIGANTGEEGFYWLGEFLRINPDLVIILMTAYAHIETAVKAIKAGATDFVAKPWQNDKLRATMSAAKKLSQAKNTNKHLRTRFQALLTEVDRPFRNIIGQSKAIQAIFNLVERVAEKDVNVLILGENGTGKEVIAREIHRLSQRQEDVFISVDLGAVSETLFESELFGHKKGAFTDAKTQRVGPFIGANKGTLFLDEIGNLPLHLQSKLLTVLERRAVTPVGSNEAIAFDTRIISATNLPIEELRSTTRFRQDLYYRINTVEIVIPPLRERREDIVLLLNHFCSQFCTKHNLEAKIFDPAVIIKLENYSWPGNVRELRHAVERAVILNADAMLTEADFGFLEVSSSELAPQEVGSLDDVERLAIQEALVKNEKNISRTARELGITRSKLYRKIEKYELL